MRLHGQTHRVFHGPAAQNHPKTQRKTQTRATRMEVPIIFGEGPLGIALTDTRQIKDVYVEGQGQRLVVLVGDLLVRVGDKDVSEIDYQTILAMIKSSERPITLYFHRKAPSAARNAVTAAGGFLKKAFVTSASLIAAVDRVISDAVDDSARVC